MRKEKEKERNVTEKDLKEKGMEEVPEKIEIKELEEKEKDKEKKDSVPSSRGRMTGSVGKRNSTLKEKKK